MPKIAIGRGLDLFAFIDSDSPEAKAFTTYLGYWEGLARLIVDIYGPNPHGSLAADLVARPQVRRLQSRAFTGDEEQLAKILLNGWAQELGLYAVDHDDPRLMLQNLWNNVQAYYASSAAARAFMLVKDGSVPEKHARTLKIAAGYVKDTRLLPEPWSYCCTSASPLGYHGFPAQPGECHNLESHADPRDIVAKALKTTRNKDLERKVKEHKQRLKVDRAPNGTRRNYDMSSPPTTVFNFMWRNRTRSNYGDPSMFYMGSLSQERSVSYVQSVQLVTSMTMLVFEGLVAQRAPKLLEETAVHFISRDRSQISDGVLGTRLRSLGLLSPSDDDEEPW